MPASPNSGQLYLVTDGADGSDCDTGSGSTQVLCIYYSSNWNPITTTNVTNYTTVIKGKVSMVTSAVDDDDCTGDQGQYWYDYVDEQFEFCPSNSGSPIPLGTEQVNALGDLGGGTDDIDLEDGTVVTATVSTSEETFTFSNPKASGLVSNFTIILTNGGSQTVNWPASVDWAGGAAPTLTASGVDILEFISVDGGTIWHGMVSSADSK
jgi:hypothetical protein